MKMPLRYFLCIFSVVFFKGKKSSNRIVNFAPKKKSCSIDAGFKMAPLF